MDLRSWVVAGLIALCACGSAQPGGTGGGSGGGVAGGSGGSGGAGGGSGSGTCQAATSALCDRALFCGSTRVVVATVSVTAEHQSVSDCKNYYLYLVCPSAAADGGSHDWAACEAAASQTSCISTAKGMAAQLPAACTGLTL